MWVPDELAEQARAAQLNVSAVTHAPAHLDAEVLSALGRMHRAGDLAASDVERGLSRLSTMPLTRHPVSDLAA